MKTLIDPGLLLEKTRFKARISSKVGRGMQPDRDHLIENPILRGFHPDPSILRVGDDYYIATSTFEWFPGVMIYHSRDLVNWRLAARPLDRVSQLDMRGNPNSGGVWAPCLSYRAGVFYLCYTNVRTMNIPLLDTPNYLVSSDRIEGKWSDPVYLNSSGFDPSLFHDDDGRSWLVNMYWNSRNTTNPFGGIVLQEYSLEQQRLIGPVKNIFKGTSIGVTEGPHLYKRNGHYYLLTAEGGTSYFHAVTMARSRKIDGPYRVDPKNPILTSKDRPELPIQKAGHASLVQTQTGEWYLAHLCGRPLTPNGRCVLGRETALQKVKWTRDGWLRLDGGGNQPRRQVPAPRLAPHPFRPAPVRDDFDSGTLGMEYQTLRVPLGEETLSLAERPGHLRMRGRESLGSRHHQALIARRQQSFEYTASTCVEFEPENSQQMAGLVCYYDTDNFCYLRVTHDEKLGKCLGIILADKGRVEHPMERDLTIEGWKKCHLRVDVKRDSMQFSYSEDGTDWSTIGPMLDASKLSDEYCHPVMAFTGAFVGICAQDLSGRLKHADFDFFEYVEGQAGEAPGE